MFPHILRDDKQRSEDDVDAQNKQGEIWQADPVKGAATWIIIITDVMM